MKKVLLARFTRGAAKGGTETLMPDGKAIDLSKDDIATLDRLTAVTGKRYYRDPVNESASEDERPDRDEPTFAESFVDRNLGDISDENIAALSDEQRAAVIEAEKAGRNRTTLLTRLAPAPTGGDGGGEGTGGDGGSGGDKDAGL